MFAMARKSCQLRLGYSPHFLFLAIVNTSICFLLTNLPVNMVQSLQKRTVAGLKGLSPSLIWLNVPICFSFKQFRIVFYDLNRCRPYA